MKCRNCKQDYDNDALVWVDDEPICIKCLYNGAQPVIIWPIGFVVNDKSRAPGNFGTTGSDVSEIHLYPEMARFMKGLADEAYLTVVWQTHKARSVKTVFRRGWDGKSVGPFASRTPDRLTPVAVTDVELLEVIGTTLIVRDLDAINGTPVLDIKVSMKGLK